MPTNVRGPLFDGRADQARREYVERVHTEIAQQAQNAVLVHLGGVLQHPTGFYEGKVATERVSATSTKVWDSWVVYGRWLEGVSSRNATTRFKGYHTFRLVAGQIKATAGARAEAILPPYLRRMN